MTVCPQPARFAYNQGMADFRFYLPIQIRYGDLDPQWHVNNARYLTFMEQTRLAYITELGLFNGQSFLDLELIVADVHITYLAPIQYTDLIRIGMRAVKLGNKSMTFESVFENADTGSIVARAETVMVHFDYRSGQSTPLPAEWRKKISEYDGIEPGP
jgi:acyl-CoA thioester hydrolase